MSLQYKAELRASLRAKRESIPALLRAKKSQAILDQLRLHPAYATAKQPGLTYAMGSEVETLALVQERISKNLPVLLPRVASEGRMVFHRIAGSLNDLVKSDFGIFEPPAAPETEVSPEEIDLLVMPGVGFDPMGNRLGQGGGYFDRFLSLVNPVTPKIALAFECQVIPSVPNEPYDKRVDEVLTERTSYGKKEFQLTSRSVEETHQFASRLTSVLKPPLTVRLSGELGAGKTEWVRGLAGTLGWRGRVRSPSFSLENVYELSELTLYHLDGYRLLHPSNLDLDRFEEILEDPEGLVLIEWPERFGTCIPPFSPELHLERLKDGNRKLTWTSYEMKHAFPEGSA